MIYQILKIVVKWTNLIMKYQIMITRIFTPRIIINIQAMKRTFLDRMHILPHRFRTTRNQFWRAVTDLELRLTKTAVPIPPEVDRSRYTPELLKPNFHHTKFLDSFMMQYFNSRPIEGVVYGEQMMLVSGPDRVGKTTFIKHCFEKFRQLKKGKTLVPPLSSHEYVPEKVHQTSDMRKVLDHTAENLMIEIDFGENKNLTFDAFIDEVEGRILQSILSTVDTFGKNKKVLITERILLKLILLQNHPSFLKTYAKDYLVSLVGELGSSDRLRQRIMTCKIFKASNSQIISQQTLFKQFSQVINILKQFNQKSTLQNTIEFYLNILKQIQYQYRPKQYANSFYRTGIQTTSFLLSTLDYFTGTLELCKDQAFIRPKYEKRANEFIPESDTTILHKSDAELIENASDIPESIVKRKSVLKPLPAPTTCIEAGEHIDTVLALLNIFETTCCNDKEFLDWYDALIMRSSNVSALRKGVPIIIELHPSTRLQDIFHQGSLPPDNPLIIDLAGYRVYKEKQTMFKFDIETYEYFRIWYALGHHPEMWKQAIIELENKGKLLRDVQKQIKNLEVTRRDTIIAKAIFNRVFTSPKAVEKMHLPKFRYELIEILNTIKKLKQLDISDTHLNIQMLDNNETTKMLVESGFLHEAYYEAFITPTRSSYASALPDIISSLKKNHVFKHALWYIRHGYYQMAWDLRYDYERMVYLGILRPRNFLKDRYHPTPTPVVQNKVSEEAYMAREDMEANFEGATSMFYNR